MSEEKVAKRRKCRTCKREFLTTAREIKAHAKACAENGKAKEE